MHFNEQAVYNFQAARVLQIYKYDFFRLNDVQLSMHASLDQNHDHLSSGKP